MLLSLRIVQAVSKMIGLYWPRKTVSSPWDTNVLSPLHWITWQLSIRIPLNIIPLKFLNFRLALKRKTFLWFGKKGTHVFIGFTATTNLLTIQYFFMFDPNDILKLLIGHQIVERLTKVHKTGPRRPNLSLPRCPWPSTLRYNRRFWCWMMFLKYLAFVRYLQHLLN